MWLFEGGRRREERKEGGVTHRQWKNTRPASVHPTSPQRRWMTKSRSTRRWLCAHFPSQNSRKAAWKQGVSALYPSHTQHPLHIYETGWSNIKIHVYSIIFILTDIFLLAQQCAHVHPNRAPQKCATSDPFNDIISMSGSDGNNSTCWSLYGHGSPFCAEARALIHNPVYNESILKLRTGTGLIFLCL